MDVHSPGPIRGSLSLHFGLVHIFVVACLVRGVATGCFASGSIAVEDWTSAHELLEQGRDVVLVGNHLWSQAWLPLAKATAVELEGTLDACPEGATLALLHGLPALDKEEGDWSSMEVLKRLFHWFSRSPLRSSPSSEWQQHWLGAIASLVSFVYGRWVKVPDGDKGRLPSEFEDGRGVQSLRVGIDLLRKHHEFLFRRVAGDFLQSGVLELPIAENSVLFTEAFAFVSFCRLHDVDVVIESGVYKGFSAEVWSHFTKEVVGVDLFPSIEAYEAARLRLSMGRGQAKTMLIQGNGQELLPKLLEERSDRQVAVFIDGPKGELAIRLALKLRELPNVAFVAIHDVAPYRSALIDFGAFFFSDEPWFQQMYRHFDAPFRMRPDLVAGGTMAFLSRGGGSGN